MNYLHVLKIRNTVTPQIFKVMSNISQQMTCQLNRMGYWEKAYHVGKKVFSEKTGRAKHDCSKW